MATQRKKFEVFKANIMDDDGVVRKHGEVVELSAKLARHYNNLGFLRPYMEEEADEGNGDDFDDASAVTAAPTPRLTRRTLSPLTTEE